MSAETSIPETDIPLLERQLALLGRLAEAGLEIAIALERQATGKLAEDQAPVAADVSLAYARVSRAVRQAVLLQSRLIDDAKTREVRALQAKDDAWRKQDWANHLLRRPQKERVRSIVARIAQADLDGDDIEDEEDGQMVERIAAEAAERLDDDTLYGDIAARPLSDLVADICRDLGLEPDWAELAQEHWAREEIESGKVGAALSELAPLPPRWGSYRSYTIGTDGRDGGERTRAPECALEAAPPRPPFHEPSG